MSSLEIHSLEDCPKCKNNNKKCCGNGEAANNSGNYNVINIGNDISRFSNEEFRNITGEKTKDRETTKEKVINNIIKEPTQYKTRIVESKIPLVQGESLITFKKSERTGADIPVKLFKDNYRIVAYSEFY